MEIEIFRKCLCCKKEFIPQRGTQVYCSRQCRERDHYLKNVDFFAKKKEEKARKISASSCTRSDCMFNTTSFINNCTALSDIGTPSECKFYKERK